MWHNGEVGQSGLEGYDLGLIARGHRKAGCRSTGTTPGLSNRNLALRDNLVEYFSNGTRASIPFGRDVQHCKVGVPQLRNGDCRKQRRLGRGDRLQWQEQLADRHWFTHCAGRS
jgi:hypothetical protein